jgi:hypothetical protein
MMTATITYTFIIILCNKVYATAVTGLFALASVTLTRSHGSDLEVNVKTLEEKNRENRVVKVHLKPER